MNTSRFIGIYQHQVDEWIRSLSLISDVIKLWIVVQQKWIYLETIFTGSTFQFGEEAKRFETVDKFYRKLMSGNRLKNLFSKYFFQENFQKRHEIRR